MRRDYELIRKILLDIENKDNTLPKEVEISGYDNDLVQYHVNLLSKEGYFESLSLEGGAMHFPQNLTWKGHDLIESIRDDTIWKKVKDQLVKTGGGVSMAVFKDLVIHTSRKVLLND